MATDDELRTAAIHSLKAKSAFRATAWSFVAIWVLLIVIWFATGAGYFWPIWPIAGMGIALAFTAYGAYGRGSTGPSENQISAEMKRLGGN